MIFKKEENVITNNYYFKEKSTEMYSRISLWYVIFLNQNALQNANAFIWRQNKCKCIQKDSIDRLMELLTLEQQKETWKHRLKQHLIA